MKKGRSNCSGLISIQTFSSLVYTFRKPGCSLASFTMSANGFCWPATAAAAAAAAAATTEPLAPERLAPLSGAAAGGAPAAGALLAAAASAAAVAATAAAATVVESGDGTVAQPEAIAAAMEEATTSIGRRSNSKCDIVDTL